MRKITPPPKKKKIRKALNFKMARESTGKAYVLFIVKVNYTHPKGFLTFSKN